MGSPFAKRFRGNQVVHHPHHRCLWLGEYKVIGISWHRNSWSPILQAALAGALKIEKPDNFSNAFEGTTGSAYGVVTSLYNVIWSYIGYSNCNYALAETKNPVRTLKIAAPLALGSVAVMYMFVNVSTRLGQIVSSLVSLSLKSVALNIDCLFCGSSQGRDYQLWTNPSRFLFPQRFWCESRARFVRLRCSICVRKRSQRHLLSGTT